MSIKRTVMTFIFFYANALWALPPESGHLKDEVSTKKESFFTKTATKAAIMKRTDQYGLCYQHALAKNPTLGGIVIFKLKISAQGQLLSINVHQSDINDASFIDCLSSEFKKVKFSKPAGGQMVSIKYPLRFKPNPNK